jgi:NAD(P)-dependent dehydrogenase (short-subunit alcohol dehydrogenase family)
MVSMKKKGKSLAAYVATGAALTMVIKALSRRRARMDFQDKVVVITGGSRGLGLVMARLFVHERARMALLARDISELERAEKELRGIDPEAEVMILPCDIREQSQVEQALARVVRRYGRLDVLINNAGVIEVGPQEHMSLEDYDDALQTHFWGPLYGMQTAITYMRQQGGGRIINIASIGGLVAVPHLAPYTASKFALVGLSDALRAELASDNIQVTTVVPGLMRTGSPVNAFFKGHHRAEYTWFSIFDSLPVTSVHAETAARQVLESVRHGDSILVISPQARAAIILQALFPKTTAGIAKLAARLMPRPEPRRGEISRSGWESQSDWSPSALTRLSDQVVVENNQLHGHFSNRAEFQPNRSTGEPGSSQAGGPATGSARQFP